jgi:choline dehydrogenase-like flavoprotein
MNYDYIIVGGGSAGSVMANRLSAKSSNKVLLCEAGQDTPHGKVPPEILDSYPGTAYFDPRFHWTELKVHTEVISHNRPEEDRPPLRKYEQARVLGGGSSINAQLANRGAPSDYDEWEARGAEGWNWISWKIQGISRVERLPTRRAPQNQSPINDIRGRAVLGRGFDPRPRAFSRTYRRVGASRVSERRRIGKGQIRQPM